MFAQHPYGAWPWAGDAWAPASTGGSSLVFWPHEWCPAPGAMRASVMAVDSLNYGDGYRFRLTRGFNPVRPKLDYEFPFAALDQLTAMDAFLERCGAAGFYFLPPDQIEPIFVTCIEWSATVVDRTVAGARAGSLRVLFQQRFNNQPIDIP